MASMCISFYCKFYISVCVVSGIANAVFLIEYQTPADCVKMSKEAVTHFYFNSVRLKCVECEQPSAAQTVSPDGTFDHGPAFINDIQITINIDLICLLKQ